LEDGTTVHLEKGSRLSFPVHFDPKKREVVLSGEAFFEVTENPSKPFYVYANELITRVLGTSFQHICFGKWQASNGKSTNRHGYRYLNKIG
jgi:transmembrane sensor